MFSTNNALRNFCKWMFATYNNPAYPWFGAILAGKYDVRHANEKLSYVLRRYNKYFSPDGEMIDPRDFDELTTRLMAK
jgi:hypothetical protein